MRESTLRAIVLRISLGQWDHFSAVSMATTVQDIARALPSRFAQPALQQPAIRVDLMPEAELENWVRKIVEVGASHGFALRADLFALVEACAMIGPDRLLAKPVLEHDALTGREKLQVLLDLHQEGFGPLG